jgi:hypothetical protein
MERHKSNTLDLYQAASTDLVPAFPHVSPSDSLTGSAIPSELAVRANWNKIGKLGRVYETASGPSTRGVVDITQHVPLKLQIIHSMLDNIADADDTGQLAAA